MVISTAYDIDGSCRHVLDTHAKEPPLTLYTEPRKLHESGLVPTSQSHSHYSQECRPDHIGGDMNKKITNVAQERLDTVQTNIMKELDMAMRGLLLVSCVFCYLYNSVCVCVSVSCHES